MKKNDRERNYICVGENYVPACDRMGYCGEVHNLFKWLMILTGKDLLTIGDYFCDISNIEIVKYILNFYGKRLKPVIV